MFHSHTDIELDATLMDLAAEVETSFPYVSPDASALPVDILANLGIVTEDYNESIEEHYRPLRYMLEMIAAMYPEVADKIFRTIEPLDTNEIKGR